VTDEIKHECGIGLLRLLKPLSWYKEKYGTALWGLNKMYLLMEKQHNRGQDGGGLACVKINAREGQPFMNRIRNNEPSPWAGLFRGLQKDLNKLKAEHPDDFGKIEFMYDNFPFAGELFLGHLRYGTHGKNSLNECHPVARSSNWKGRSIMVAGNFNLTNVDTLFDYLVDLGMHPRYMTDTETVLERIGHFLDQEYERVSKEHTEKGHSTYEVARLAARDLDIRRIMQNSATKWDGGYTMGGVIGCGDAFIARDPQGIRPCFWYANDEFVVAASERPTIFTTFNVPYDEIHELEPGQALIVKASGKVETKAFTEPKEKKSCSFERIYFSRGNDPDIYRERLALGDLLVPKILEVISNDLDNTVFSYIPNTAESAFWGMIKGVETHMNNEKLRLITELGANATAAQLEKIIQLRPRVEKAVLKDIKLRTFITDDSQRDDLVGHVYDITANVLNRGKDNFVCIDDSIVRGTTLRKSILRILSRLGPKKIVIVSSSPQIRYPDCYGIDMSRIGEFVAFQAAVALLHERGKEVVLHRVYREVAALKEQGLLESKNAVKAIYDPFTEDEISRKVAELITPPDLGCKVEIVFQPLSNLPKAIPHHRGDWYFSGNYPTPGGNRVVNQAFMNYMEGKKQRAY
jgi:amidophosphoribosyltransferase